MSQKPPTGGQGGGADGGSSSNTTYDVKDANKDGTVSLWRKPCTTWRQSQQAKKGQSTQATSNSTANGVAGETIEYPGMRAGFAWPDGDKKASQRWSGQSLFGSVPPRATRR